jgi:hypothetical protein
VDSGTPRDNRLALSDALTALRLSTVELGRAVGTPEPYDSGPPVTKDGYLASTGAARQHVAAPLGLTPPQRSLSRSGAVAWSAVRLGSRRAAGYQLRANTAMTIAP